MQASSSTALLPPDTIQIGDQLLTVNGTPVVDWESTAIATHMQAVDGDHVVLGVRGNTVTGADKRQLFVDTGMSSL